MTTTAQPDAAAPGRAIRMLTVYRVVSRAYFHLPVLFVFLYQGGLSVWQVTALMALYGLVVAATQVVTGRFTTGWPLTTTLIVGECIKIGGLICIASGPGILSATAGQVLSGIGFALTAGTDSALLSTLTAGADFRRREATTQGWMFAGSFAAGAVGALLFTHVQRLPFLASGVAALLAAICLVVVATSIVRRPAPGSLDGTKDTPPPATARPSQPATAPVPPARPANAAAGQQKIPMAGQFWRQYYSLNRAFLLAPYVGFIPYLLVTRLDLGISWFGAFLGLYTLSGFAAARLSPHLVGRISPRRLAAVPAVLTVCGLGLLSVAELAADLPSIVALGLAGGLIRPTAMANLEPLLQELSPERRRGLTGRMEQQQAIWSAAILLVGGGLLTEVSTTWLFLGLAAVNLSVQVLILAGSRNASTAREGGTLASARTT